MRLTFLLLSIVLGFYSCNTSSSSEKKVNYTILGLGDSITEGGADSSSYPWFLQQLLEKEGYNVEFIGPKQRTVEDVIIKHAGYSGQTVEYLESIIDSIYTKYPADIVLLHAGHNHFADEKPVAGIIETYHSIIQKIKKINPDVTILIAKVITSGKLPKYSYIPELNIAIDDMAIELNDPKLIVVDQAKDFDWKKHTIEDMVHPNKEGGELMASVWYNALVKILPVQRKISKI